MDSTINLCQLKSIQLEIMDYFHSWCIAHKLTYFITAGTLIGALRHKGFIPWDDDIDVVMLRRDYDLFMKEFPKDNTGKYRLLSIETEENCMYPYAKIYDSETVLIEGNERNHSSLGINIDIFPLDNATDNIADAIKLKKRIKIFNDVLGVKQLDRVNRGFKKNTIVVFLKLLSKPISSKWLVRSIVGLSKKYLENDDSRFIVNAVIYAKGEREILEREWFKETQELDFEGRRYLAPIGADQYMRRLFGDYMQLPPEDKRVSHHRFRAYYK